MLGLLTSISALTRGRGVSPAVPEAVTYPSTSGIIKKMERMGLVEHERYGYVRLTERGREVGEIVARREEFLFKFFTEFLKLDEDLAREDACRVEHAISQITADRLVDFINSLLACPTNVKTGRLEGFLIDKDGKPIPVPR